MTDTLNLLTSMAVMRSQELDDELEHRGVRPGYDTGEPMTSNRVFFDAHSTRVGVWECSPGGWEIQNRPDTETMLLLKGHVRMTTQGEDPVELREGDVFVLPKGWSGRWDVLETARKLFVVVE